MGARNNGNIAINLLNSLAVLPYKRLMRTCHWMESHFHDWIDYSGVAHFLIFGVR